MAASHCMLLIAVCLAGTLAQSTLPKWAPTWDMQSSTIVQPCNDSGYLEPVDFYAQFGIVDVMPPSFVPPSHLRQIDWSNAKALWVNPPMTTEELLVKQVAFLKAARPETKVFVYRNLVKALPWYTSVRAKITNPQYSGWFLHSKPGGSLPGGQYHVPQCDKNYNPPLCTDLYHDLDQTPGYPHGDGSCPGPCDCGSVPCGEYLWDHRNASLKDWFINDFVLGPTGLANPNISGFFFDDGWANTSQPVKSWQPKEGFCDHSPIGGATEESFWCTADMGLTQADTTAITDGWTHNMNAVKEAVIAGGGFSWAYFHSFQTPNNKTCSTTLRSLCSAGEQSPVYTAATMHQYTNPKTYPLTSFNEDLATFLLVRGPYAWLGYGWVGCGVKYEFRDALKADYGIPQGVCKESAPGVFTREYTKATAQMDCNKWVGTVTMK